MSHKHEIYVATVCTKSSIIYFYPVLFLFLPKRRLLCRQQKFSSSAPSHSNLYFFLLFLIRLSYLSSLFSINFFKIRQHSFFRSHSIRLSCLITRTLPQLFLEISCLVLNVNRIEKTGITKRIEIIRPQYTFF